jgi:two-component system, LytTR family, sensor kinase
LLTPPVFELVRRYQLKRTGLVTGILVYATASVIFAALFLLLRWSLFPAWNGEERKWLPRTMATLIALARGGTADVLMMYLPILALAHAWVYYGYNRQYKLEEAELRRGLAEQQLQILKMQLHPHFLFNTLQGIATLMRRDVATAERMQLRLSELLRTAIQHQHIDVVTLEEELSFLDSYVQIEHMRFDHRLDVEVHAATDTLPYLVPHMILQPLVENAIVHGIEPVPEGGWVRIDSALANNTLKLSVKNSVPTVRRENARGHGMGLQNTRARLQSLYGSDATLIMRYPSATEAEVVVILPAIKADMQEDHA